MRLYGLIGMPLEHSRSREWFSRRFAERGMYDCRYENFPLARIEELPELLKTRPNLRGLNVTSPYKREVIPYLDELSDKARRTGSVNCIRIESGKLSGHNTDCYGFRRSLLEFIGEERPDALILGTGGAASAAAEAMAEIGIDYRQVSRTPACGMLGYADLSGEIMTDRRLIVNATPLGMFPAKSLPPVPYALLGPQHILYDMVYNPRQTPFLSRGKAAGARTANGLRMLELQAERSWELFGLG